MTDNIYNNGEISVDADILQSRKDVLRAKDIFPNYTNSKQNLSPNLDEKAKYQIPSFNELRNSTTFEVSQSQTAVAEIPEPTVDETIKQFPKFDLAMQILENQRRTASFKRTAPSDRTFVAPPISKQIIQQEPTSVIDAMDEIIEKELEETEPQILQSPNKIIVEATPHVSSFRPHIADRIRLVISKSEESIINEIVKKDIERFLKIA